MALLLSFVNTVFCCLKNYSTTASINYCLLGVKRYQRLRHHSSYYFDNITSRYYMYSFETFIFYTDRANSPLKIILREGKERFL